MINVNDFLSITAPSEHIQAHFTGHCEDSFELRDYEFERPEHEYVIISCFSMYDKYEMKDSYLDVTIMHIGEDKNYA